MSKRKTSPEKASEDKIRWGGIPASVLRSIKPLVGRSLRPVTVSTDASGSDLVRFRKFGFYSIKDLIMNKLIAGALVASALALPSTAGAATLMNNSFENGLTGWQAAPGALVSVVSNFTNSGTASSFSPMEGNNFAVLQAGNTDVATGLTQFFSMNAGETIKFAVAFVGDDYSPFDDSAFLSVFSFQNSVNTVLFKASVPSVGDFTATPWTFVSFTADLTGQYSVNASIQNAFDENQDSFLLIDAVPEPSTWLMMLFGFAAVGYSMRRKQNVRVSFA